MRLLPALRKPEVLEAQRDAVTVTLDDYMGYVNELIYNGVGYVTLGGVNQTQPGQKQEFIGPQYKSLASLAYKSNGIVFACMLTRALHFSEVRFQFRQINNGRPGKLFGNQDLLPLEEPWVGGTTGDLLTRMLLHADLSGNAFVVRRGDRLDLLRPDWVTIVIGSNTDQDSGAWASDAEVVGYVYSPGGYGAADYEPERFLPEEVAHFAPIPDPEARFRGMSWITALLREIMADKAATEHKLGFFENPTPNMVVKFDVPDLAELKESIALFKSEHEGARNAYKYLFAASGTDAQPVGSNLKDLDYKMVTGAGETRIAAAARTPPVMVGLSEGLQGSALNSGNYQAARRMFADGCIRPLWRNAAGSLAHIIAVPAGAELWTDDRDVAFLKEDLIERAEVMLKQAQTIRYLVDSGYKPDTVIAAVEAEDFSMLEHSGLFSVQLQAANAPRQGLFTGTVVPNTGGRSSNGSIDDFANGNGNGPLTRADLDALISEHRPDETHVHFEEGAFRFDLPEQPDVHIHEGAFRADVAPADVHVDAPVTSFAEGAFQTHVEPARVDFAEGAIRVDAPVTVEPTQVDIHEGAFRSETTVEPARVDFAAGAIRVDAPIAVEPARVEIAEGAVRVDAPVTVEPSHVTVEAPEIHVHPPDQRPRKATATRGEDGSLTVSYEDEETPDGD